MSMQQRKLIRREQDGSLVVHADLSEVAPADLNDMVVAADGTAYVGNWGSEVVGGILRVPPNSPWFIPTGR